MSSVYTPSPVQLGGITIPSDGDGPHIKAADVNVPIEGIADGVKYCEALDTFDTARLNSLADLTALAAILTPTDGLVRHVLGQGVYVFKTSATTGLSPFWVAATDATPGGWVSSTAHQLTLTRVVNASHLPVPLVGAQGLANLTAASQPANLWPPASSTTTSDVVSTSASGVSVGLQLGMAVNTAAALAHPYRFAIDQYLVDGATLNSVTLKLTGHGILPNSMPKIGITRVDVSGASTQLLSTGNGVTPDTSATGAAYAAKHDIVFTPDQNNVVDKATYSYAFWCFDEAGANALVGQVLLGLTFAQTIPDGRRS